MTSQSMQSPQVALGLVNTWGNDHFHNGNVFMERASIFAEKENEDPFQFCKISHLKRQTNPGPRSFKKSKWRQARRNVYVGGGAAPSPIPWQSGRWRHRTLAAWGAPAQALPSPRWSWGSRAEGEARPPESESAAQLPPRGGSWKPAAEERYLR